MEGDFLVWSNTVFFKSLATEKRIRSTIDLSRRLLARRLWMTLIRALLRQGERYAIYSRFNQTITLVARPPIRAPILLPLLLVPSNRIQLYAKSSRLVRTPRRVEHSSLFFRGGNTITKGGRGKEDRRNFCVVPIIAFFLCRSLNLFNFPQGTGS